MNFNRHIEPESVATIVAGVGIPRLIDMSLNNMGMKSHLTGEKHNIQLGVVVLSLILSIFFNLSQPKPHSTLPSQRLSSNQFFSIRKFFENFHLLAFGTVFYFVAPYLPYHQPNSLEASILTAIFLGLSLQTNYTAENRFLMNFATQIMSIMYLMNTEAGWLAPIYRFHPFVSLAVILILLKEGKARSEFHFLSFLRGRDATIPVSEPGTPMSTVSDSLPIHSSRSIDLEYLAGIFFICLSVVDMTNYIYGYPTFLVGYPLIRWLTYAVCLFQFHENVSFHRIPLLSSLYSFEQDISDQTKASERSFGFNSLPNISYFFYFHCLKTILACGNELFLRLFSNFFTSSSLASISSYLPAKLMNLFGNTFGDVSHFAPFLLRLFTLFLFSVDVMFLVHSLPLRVNKH
jgi:hypothetical protein